MPNDPYYQTKKHKDWRAKVLRAAGFLCVECKRFGRHVEATHAHHIKDRHTYPELQYVVSNGRALCGPCHNKTEPRTGGPPRSGGYR